MQQSVGDEQLKQLEQLRQLAAEHAPIPEALIGPDGVVLSVNRALCHLLRSDVSQLVGSHYVEFTHPDDRARHERLFQEAVAGIRDGYRLTKRCRRVDGSHFQGDLSVNVLRDETGRVQCLVGQLVDVTAQRVHEQQLREALESITRQRELTQGILDTVDVGLLLIDRDGHYEAYNRRHRHFLDLSYPEGHHGRAGQPGHIYYDDGVTALTSEEMPSTRAARGEEFDDLRIWIGEDPAERRAISVSARALFDPSGEFVGSGLAYSDVTELMRSIQMRDDFLASVSHELRTPLASVVGYLELLGESVDVGEEARHQIEVLQRNAARLRDLVSDLLESAEQRTGPVVLAATAADVSRIVEEALEAAVPAGWEAGVELRGEIEPGVRGVVDAGRVRQVIDNLVSNGIKYSDRGDHVLLTLRGADGAAVIEVSDTGIGMSEDDLERLFTPFYRSAQARARLSPGVGLGLGICQAIVAAHGGRIEVRSTLGEGTVFTATLPLG